MAKLKRSRQRNTVTAKREIFHRRAKEQSIVNLEQIAVIMKVVEPSSGSEDESITNDNKKLKKSVKKPKKKNKQRNMTKQNMKTKFQSSKSKSLERNDSENGFTTTNLKGRKSNSQVLPSNSAGLSHFMELGARTDLLCDSSTADPLGPDGFDNFQWVEVKQELPDDIEVCKVTLAELPFKTDDASLSDVNASEDVDTSRDSAYPSTDLDPGYKTEDDFSPREVLDKAVETDNGFSEEIEEKVMEFSICREGSLSENENSSADRDDKESKRTEDVEEIQPLKKKKYRPQQCDICDKKLYSKGNLRLHKLKKHKLKVQFTCELCSLKFDLRREAVKHRNSVHRGDDGRFGCEVCSKRVLDYYSFLVHLRSHEDISKEAQGSDKTCVDCDKAFSDDEGLRAHRNVVHSIDLRGRLKSQEKNFTCDTCGRRFAFSCLLRDHINTHTGAKPYLCQECGKAFCQKSTLQHHAKTHSSVRPFQCSECPQGFYSKGDFIKHQRKHTGERPYVCEVCGEGFSRSTHLVIHRRTHTGEKPHVCDICDRGFTKRGDVVRHRRVHTGELPYLCQVCGKAFRQSTQCANHIKSQHPDSPALVARNPNPLAHRTHIHVL